MKKRIGLLGALLSMVLFLSACGDQTPITEADPGFWNDFIVRPLSNFIIWIADLFGGNFGIGIIVATIIIRFAILPLMLKQIKSTKAMQAMQPEVKQLQQKYSSKDQETQRKLQQETMELYKKYGVNPLAGCLPLLIQMPILIGMFQAITRTTAIGEQSFLWFHLGTPDPLFILPVIAGLTTYFSQRLTMAGSGGDNPQMKVMLYAMPLMITFFGIQMPAALGLHWAIGNIFTVIQTMIVRGPDIKVNAEKRREGK